jgi:hypothetical protein
VGCAGRSSGPASCWRLTTSLPALLLAGCTGIFQQPLPEVAASFARRAAGVELRVGAAEADITPPGPVMLGGFDMARGSTGVQSPLAARALVLIAGELKVAVVGLDNLGVMREDVDWIKAGIAGFANGCVFVCSSHTHAGPDLIGLWGYYYLSTGRDPEYVALVRARVADAVRRAEASARPARVLRGQDRLPRSGLVRNSNRGGLFDPRLTVLHAVATEDGRPLGTLLHLGCHPEVLRRGNTLISADFVGELCDRWRAAGHGQAVFVNGALGAMVTPQLADAAGLQATGERLFEHADRALRSASASAVADVEVRRRDVYLPLTSPGLVLGRLTGAIERRAYADRMRTGVGYLRIGEVEIACVPGEMEPALAEKLRRATCRPNLLVFGLVDDEIGYLMREVDARDRHFAYERLMSPCLDAGERIVAALAAAVRLPQTQE